MYFCAACNVYVKETSASDHDQSTAHMLSTTKAPTLRKGTCSIYICSLSFLVAVPHLRLKCLLVGSCFFEIVCTEWIVWLPESNRGYRLLMNMGWQEDSGLGSKGDGRMDPIATVFKTDRAGVGAQPTAKLARVTHFPAHDEHQQRSASDGLSDAQRMQERLARKRKQDLQRVPSEAERKARRLQDQQRDRAIARELYATGLDGYEEYLE